MAGDVPQRQYYARKAKTAAQYRVFDLVIGAKRRRHSKMRVFVDNGVANKGNNTSEILLQLDDGDMISNLPQDVVHCILDRLSVHDAAKTSVLSKEWRCKWGMKTNLVLDKLFFSNLTCNKDEDTHQSAFLRAIEMIALVHKGPLLSFKLYIPPKLDQCLVSQWTEHFLNKDMRVLEFTNSEKNAYEIPLFVCEGLVELKLTTGIITPLLKLGNFTNLIQVTLLNILISADVSFGSQLKQLHLYSCTGIQHLGCQFTNANNLTKLLLYQSEHIEWRWFEFTKQLKAFGLSLTTTNPNMRMPINLIKLLSTTPTLSLLFLSGYTIEVLGPIYFMFKGLAPKIENLKLIGLGFHNSCQLSNSLYLIRCLCNLQILRIVLEPGVKSLNQTVEQFLESLDWKDLLLDQLHTVVIRGVVGETTVLHFIKILLASSPSLKEVSLFCNIKANAHEEIWKIKQELCQCYKKSLAAKFDWSFLAP